MFQRSEIRHSQATFSETQCFRDQRSDIARDISLNRPAQEQMPEDFVFLRVHGRSCACVCVCVCVRVHVCACEGTAVVVVVVGVMVAVVVVAAGAVVVAMGSCTCQSFVLRTRLQFLDCRAPALGTGAPQRRPCAR